MRDRLICDLGAQVAQGTLDVDTATHTLRAYLWECVRELDRRTPEAMKRARYAQGYDQALGPARPWSPTEGKAIRYARSTPTQYVTVRDGETGMWIGNLARPCVGYGAILTVQDEVCSHGIHTYRPSKGELWEAKVSTRRVKGAHVKIARTLVQLVVALSRLPS